MLRYLTKGFTVGHIITRNILRTFTGVPGLAVDTLVSLFWVPNFQTYWDSQPIEYFDGTKVNLFRGITGYIGELTGYIVGIPVGLALSLSLFAVDAVLMGIAFFYNSLRSKLAPFAQWLGNTPFFKHFQLYKNPRDALTIAWNISSVLIGGTIAVVPYLFFKFIEFFIPPLENTFSVMTLGFAGGLAGMVGGVITIPFIPVFYLLERFGKLYLLAREALQTVSAVLYAKSNEQLDLVRDGDTTHPDYDMHSPEFTAKYNRYKNASWITILFGLEAELNNSCCGNNDNEPVDPITLETLGINGATILIDQEGHRFNLDTTGNKTEGILRWLGNKNKSCPVSRHDLHEHQLSLAPIPR